MATKSSGLQGSNDTLSTLDVAIQDLHRAKEACGVPPAQVAFASVGDLLTMTAVRSTRFYENEPPVHG